MAGITSAPRNFARGLAYVPRGYRFLREHRALWPLSLVPAVLTGSALLVLPWWAWRKRAAVVLAIWPETASPGWSGALLGVAHGLFEVLASLLLIALSVLLAALLASVLSAPFNDLLSERVEELATGLSSAPFRWSVALREAVRAVQFSVIRGAVYTLLVVSGWTLSWLVPGVGQALHVLLAVPLTLAYLSLDQVDYAAARRGWPVAERIGLVRREPALMLGFGASVWLCLCVPLLNVLFMPVSVTGGTLLVLDLQRAPPEL